MTARNEIERRLRISGILAIAGLGAEFLSLLHSGPGAFFLFMFGAGSLLGAAILVFLRFLVAITPE